MAKAKQEEKETNSDLFKQLLSAQIGGAADDWKRTKKKSAMWGDTDRTFVNKKTGQEVMVFERQDGLLYTYVDEDKGFTARLPISGEFNAAAKPATVDVVMNMILESKPEIDDALYEQAMKEGLAKRFSFTLATIDNGDDNPEVIAYIFPSTRDETFRTAAYIRPLVPKADSTDECMADEWRFEEDLNTPAKIVTYLRGQGLTWDEEYQKREPDLYAETKKELGETVAKPKSKGPKA